MSLARKDIKMLRRSLSCGSMTYDHDKKSNFAVLNQSNLDVTSTKYSIKSWFLADVNDKIAKQKLPLQSFNHISREVICLQKSLRFYVDILGFIAVPRPPFEVEGVWLWGYGLSLHLILTTRKQERLDLLRKRLEHFSDCLPSVDHIAFVTDDLSRIEKLLDEANCYYKKTSSEAVGINQIFFFDPGINNHTI